MERIYAAIIGCCLLNSVPAYAQKTPISTEYWQSIERRFDRKKILNSSEMRTDTSPRFLTVPESYGSSHDFYVADIPPEIDFGIIQGYRPWYLPVLYQNDHLRGGIWEGYGDVTSGPDECFYFSIGDHRGYDGTAYIYRYDPARKSHIGIFDLRDAAGYTPNRFADSKIHGDLDIGPGGSLYFLTYFGPAPTRDQWDNEYTGSMLFRINVLTGDTINFGVPLEGSTWPYYNCDWDRHTFFAVAEDDGKVIVFDTDEERMVYGGAPKNGIRWHRRCTMLDHDTGVWYSTDTMTYLNGERYRGEQYLVSYRKQNNEFRRLACQVPENPVNGKSAPLRAHTESKDADGAFWCFSENGVLFRFWPEEERTKYVGLNWGDGVYIPNMTMSPDGRYFYYIANEDGMPVVQYEISTGRKKVIAFIEKYYIDEYGYCPAKFYGLELDESGESLFFYLNGGFAENRENLRYARPAMFHLFIPPEERTE